MASWRCLKYFPRSRGSVRKNHFKSRFLSSKVKNVMREKSIIKTIVEVTLDAKEIPKSDTCQKLFCVIDWISPILLERLFVIRDVFSSLSIILANISVSNSLRIMFPVPSGSKSRNGKLPSAWIWIVSIPRSSACFVLFPRSIKIGTIARINNERNMERDQKERKMARVSETFHLWICHLPK